MRSPPCEANSDVCRRASAQGPTMRTPGRAEASSPPLRASSCGRTHRHTNSHPAGDQRCRSSREAAVVCMLLSAVPFWQLPKWQSRREGSACRWGQLGRTLPPPPLPCQSWAARRPPQKSPAHRHGTHLHGSHWQTYLASHPSNFMRCRHKKGLLCASYHVPVPGLPQSDAGNRQRSNGVGNVVGFVHMHSSWWALVVRLGLWRGWARTLRLLMQEAQHPNTGYKRSC